MELDSVRELKMAAMQVVATIPKGITAAGVVSRFVSLGVAAGSTSQGYRLAIRLQQDSLGTNAIVDRLKHIARGEVDIRITGRVRPAALASPATARKRPIHIGSSVAHFNMTAGTLGAFVQTDNDDSVHLLSNNHVIANSNACGLQDSILQPSPMDGGLQGDRVAGLANWIPLQTQGNLVDCAIAKLDPDVTYDAKNVPQIGPLGGVSTNPIYIGMPVSIFGRSSKMSDGKVTAFEMDNILVGYPVGDLGFDGQIEIEGARPDMPFAIHGDSGSLVMDKKRLAIGLLFAVSTNGGTNGLGLTYVNPIDSVLQALNAQILY
ncbi:hypothetical protein OU994_17495 [Pseudoduganella sp. SL102]|uniref:hypothetical protein n=1 Tax=Pseudoduganella sp. SL102 TaxID=2995154 RepID=UPI00248C3AFC|nr:hypothetical protein [Pseudoduganella sp. SL102]WBS00118.1 hypothetical protein OU994_17495 [Pseudoduganella sp. SL102]